MDKQRCKELVYHSSTWRPFQCKRYAVKDGYCKQHHPEAVKERDEIRERKWRRERKAYEAPYKRIKYLEGLLRDNGIPFVEGRHG